MNESVVVCGPGAGKTLLVGGGDRVTYKVRSADTSDAYFCFEVSTTPGFGPPLHSHEYRELFYVLEGEYEFTFEQDGERRVVTGHAGTAVAIPPNVPHTFKNASGGPARLLFVHQPAALEEFFEEFGVPVDAAGQPLGGAASPDPRTMRAALERNGVHVVGAPA